MSSDLAEKLCRKPAQEIAWEADERGDYFSQL